MKTLFTLLFAGSGFLFAQSNLDLVALNHFSEEAPAISREATVYRTSSSVSFKKVKNILLVEGVVEGKTGTYILDTGAPGLVVNEKPENTTGKFKGSGIFKKVELGLKRTLQFSIGKFERKNLATHTLDISELSKILKTDIHGLMGYDIFQGKSLFINQKERYVEVYPKRKTVFELIGKPDYKIPFILMGHFPVITAKIGKEKIFCCIDTGSSIHLIDEEKSREHCQDAKEPSFEYFKGLGSKTVTRRKTKVIPRLETGNAVIWDTECVPADLSQLHDNNNPWKVKALLGMPFFEDYSYVLIDYRSLNIYLWN
jgi:hypothetical protein